MIYPSKVNTVKVGDLVKKMGNTIIEYKPTTPNAERFIARARQVSEGNLSGIPQKTIQKRDLNTDSGRAAYARYLVTSAQEIDQSQQW